MPGLRATRSHRYRLLVIPSPVAPTCSRWARLAPVAWSSVWLLCLVPTVLDAVRSGAWLGAAAIVTFSGVYVAAWVAWQHSDWSVVRTGLDRPSLTWIGVAAALSFLAITQVGQVATYMLIYVAIMTVLRTPFQVGLPTVAVAVVVVELLARVVPGWEPDYYASLFITLGAGIAAATRLGIERRVREERAALDRHRLELAEQRNRMARDVHDILGHSLTVITVKAELAGRLLEATPEGLARARAEIADVEALARGALADVRRTVAGDREMSLATEVLTARQALTAAGIELTVDGAPDAVADDLEELFAWGVREGVTNVVRHSGARHCRITLGRHGLVIADDGRGPRDLGWAGHRAGVGLHGLTERARQAGATLLTGRSPLGGFEVRVDAS